MKREYIQDSIRLSGESSSGTFERTFKIVSKIAAGSSAVCYEAYHAGSGKGILKEFYPRDTYGRYILETNPENISDKELLDSLDSVGVSCIVAPPRERDLSDFLVSGIYSLLAAACAKK